MTKSSDLQHLRMTVESVREELCPSLPAAFVTAVIDAEEEYPDDAASALRAIEEALARVREAQD